MKSVPKNFPAFLKDISQYGTKTALIDYKTQKKISYLKLFTLAHSFSKKINIASGERVILYKLPPLEWVVLFFALQIRGAIVVPIDSRIEESFIKKIIHSTQVKYIIGECTLETDIPIYSYNQIEKIPEFFSISPKSQEKNTTDPCQIIFTSGTWSIPKGVTLSQQNILKNVEQILSIYPHQNSQLILAILPLSHSYQQTVGLFAPLFKGDTLVFLEVQNSLDLISAIQKHKIESITLIPKVLTLLKNAITRKISSPILRKFFIQFVIFSRIFPLFLRRKIFSGIHATIGKSLSLFISGGAPLRLELDHFFQGLGYTTYIGYGLSECSPILTACFDQHRKEKQVGKPLPEIEITINKNQEIICTGENLFVGYWPNKRKNIFFNTQDCGKIDTQGNIILQGRNKHLIMFKNGEKCFYEDIENIIEEIPEIEKSCIIQEENQKNIYFLYTTHSDLEFSEEKIHNYLKKKIPMGMKLTQGIQVKKVEMPYTHTLKIHRTKTKALLNFYQSNTKTNSSCESNHKN